ncbi:hypothetical protein AGQ47_24670 [Salmonella enterica subsp. enterica]|uniref:YcfL family protein n=1 Tax=Salmonella enterica TaxID=28901 RepID=UPI00077A9B63|nr:YcfL family protein [Salmonella enterica]KYB46316.1 hypothetical protein AGQ47_24670 [Salmonella enterica subsp. enterica]
MIKGRIAVSPGCVLLSGGGSGPESPGRGAQSLGVESTVLGAGGAAGRPELTASDGQPSASSRVYNERQEPITVNYRFYWYVARPLEMHPLEAPRSVTIPPRSSVTLFGSAHYLGAHKVRLYLYL